eukprot:TRINITY_DN49472_c0_g1_i2.p1 TRINITY_DN49472_c0_g1~~TRINITY_DN49472_c0_g1_i2.p1  ORF type:complete len:230 (-),score=49.07 TRINITY_DN49472_c0_g1_i2:464-1153(-)
MCIRDRYQRRVRGSAVVNQMGPALGCGDCRDCGINLKSADAAAQIIGETIVSCRVVRQYEEEDEKGEWTHYGDFRGLEMELSSHVFLRYTCWTFSEVRCYNWGNTGNFREECTDFSDWRTMAPSEEHNMRAIARFVDGRTISGVEYDSSRITPSDGGNGGRLVLTFSDCEASLVLSSMKRPMFRLSSSPRFQPFVCKSRCCAVMPWEADKYPPIKRKMQTTMRSFKSIK